MRGELTNSVPVAFSDDERRVDWTFSHDSMRFEGRTSGDGQRRGPLGIGEGSRPFDRPPVSVGDGVLVDARSIANFDTELEAILPRVQVPAGETIAAAPVAIGESIALLTDKALYFYDGEVLQADDRAFPARQRVPLVRKIGNLERVDVMELLDGYLVAETFGRGAPQGAGDPLQFVLHADGSGTVRQVADRALTNDFPALSRFQPTWLSPLLASAYDAAVELFAPPTPLGNHDRAPTPAFVWVLALALCVAAAVGAWWWSGRVALAMKRRIGWTAASAVVGLPALFSLMLFHPRSAEQC